MNARYPKPHPPTPPSPIENIVLGVLEINI